MINTSPGTPTNTIYQFAPVVVLPTVTVGVSTAVDIVVSVPPINDQTNYPGSVFIYPDLNAMLQPGSANNLLKPYASSADLSGGFGLLYVRAAVGLAEVVVPVSLAFAPGYTYQDVIESPGTPTRLLLNPLPGGSFTNLLPAGRDVRLYFEKMLPGMAVPY